VRSLIVVGGHLHDECGRIVGTEGFYIDATPHVRQQQDPITAQLAEIAGHRAELEPAKGMLMATCGITANHAFEPRPRRPRIAHTGLALGRCDPPGAETALYSYRPPSGSSGLRGTPPGN
jgi:hypothetical protein